MPDSGVSPQVLGFLADLAFVGCLFAVVLYGLWFLLKRASLVGMARLSLVVSFGAVVTLFGVGMSQGQAMSYPLFYLFILLTSDAGRNMLCKVRTVIVDELHAVAGSKRGAHLALTLERLAALCGRSPVRIGLSATQKPIALMAELLCGADAARCTIVDTGHKRQRDPANACPRHFLYSPQSRVKHI